MCVCVHIIYIIYNFYMHTFGAMIMCCYKGGREGGSGLFGTLLYRKGFKPLHYITVACTKPPFAKAPSVVLHFSSEPCDCPKMNELP